MFDEVGDHGHQILLFVFSGFAKKIRARPPEKITPPFATARVTPRSSERVRCMSGSQPDPFPLTATSPGNC
jgi:hypothetical protein